MFSVCCARWSSAGNLREDIRADMIRRPVSGGPLMGQGSQLNIFSDGPSGAVGGLGGFTPIARGPAQSTGGVLPPDQGRASEGALDGAEAGKGRRGNRNLGLFSYV